MPNQLAFQGGVTREQWSLLLPLPRAPQSLSFTRDLLPLRNLHPRSLCGSTANLPPRNLSPVGLQASLLPASRMGASINMIVKSKTI